MKGHCACVATGLSSHAIARAFGHCARGGTDHPHDPADLKRCLDYCRETSVGTERLAEVMAPVSPQWAALTAEWDSLAELLAEEYSTGPRAEDLRPDEDPDGSGGMSTQTANPQQLRDEGMATVENGTDPRLILAVDAAIADLNASGQDWSANELRDRLPVVPPALIGARVKAATMRKPIEMRRVGWVLSDLPSTKSKPIGVYRGAKHADTLFDESSAS